MQRTHDEGVTAPLGTAILIGVVILLAVGLFFMVRVFTDEAGSDPQSLATFQVDEGSDTLAVRNAEPGVRRSEFEIRFSVDGDFDDRPVTAGTHAFAAGRFVPLGEAIGGPSDAEMTAGTTFHICAAGGPANHVTIDIRHLGSNSVIWRGSFAGLAACP